MQPCKIAGMSIVVGSCALAGGSSALAESQSGPAPKVVTPGAALGPAVAVTAGAPDLSACTTIAADHSNSGPICRLKPNAALKPIANVLPPTAAGAIDTYRIVLAVANPPGQALISASRVK